MSVVKPASSAQALAYLEKQKSLNLMKSSGTQEFVQTSSASPRLPAPESSTLWALIVGGGLVLAIKIATYVQHRRRVLSERVLIEPEGRSVFNTFSRSKGFGDYDGSGGDGGGCGGNGGDGGDGGGCGGDGGDGGDGGCGD